MKHLYFPGMWNKGKKESGINCLKISIRWTRGETVDVVNKKGGECCKMKMQFWCQKHRNTPDPMSRFRVLSHGSGPYLTVPGPHFTVPTSKSRFQNVNLLNWHPRRCEGVPPGKSLYMVFTFCIFLLVFFPTEEHFCICAHLPPFCSIEPQCWVSIAFLADFLSKLTELEHVNKSEHIWTKISKAFKSIKLWHILQYVLHISRVLFCFMFS